jgi:hypothetical protein
MITNFLKRFFICLILFKKLLKYFESTDHLLIRINDEFNVFIYQEKVIITEDNKFTTFASIRMKDIFNPYFIRKILSKRNPSEPDNFHLHHLLFLFLKKKLGNKKIINSLTGIIINLYNFLIFFISSQFYSKTNFLFILIIINILIYTFCYIFLYRKNKKFTLA